MRFSRDLLAMNHDAINCSSDPMCYICNRFRTTTKCVLNPASQRAEGAGRRDKPESWGPESYDKSPIEDDAEVVARLFKAAYTYLPM